ncbi:MAG: hypothetical protein WCA44_03155 [Acidobacteriaceae bacterium]
MIRQQVRPGIFLTVAAFLFGARLLCAQATLIGVTNAVTIADGTPIHLVLMDDLQGRKLQRKQIVHFEVREDVIVRSRTLIRTGATAIGHIEAVSKSGLFGKSGRLVLQFDYVESVTGGRIALRGGAGVTGGKGGALTLESAMWYGPNANLPVGTAINAFVDKDQRVLLP